MNTNQQNIDKLNTEIKALETKLLHDWEFGTDEDSAKTELCLVDKHRELDAAEEPNCDASTPPSTRTKECVQKLAATYFAYKWKKIHSGLESESVFVLNLLNKNLNLITKSAQKRAIIDKDHWEKELVKFHNDIAKQAHLAPKICPRTCRDRCIEQVNSKQLPWWTVLSEIIFPCACQIDPVKVEYFVETYIGKLRASKG